MKSKSQARSWTQILVAEIEAHRRETGMSREAFAQDVVVAWQASGAPQIGRDWKTDGDVFEQARTNGQRLYRWLDDVSKDTNLLPLNVVPAILLALPEARRVRVINAQLEGFGLMVERVPSAGDAAALNDLLTADIKEASEAHQAMVVLASQPTPEAAEAARRELVESIAASSAALSHVEAVSRRLSQDRRSTDRRTVQ